MAVLSDTQLKSKAMVDIAPDADWLASKGVGPAGITLAGEFRVIRYKSVASSNVSRVYWTGPSNLLGIEFRSSPGVMYVYPYPASIGYFQGGSWGQWVHRTLRAPGVSFSKISVPDLSGATED